MNCRLYTLSAQVLPNGALSVAFGCVANEADATLPSYVSPTKTALIQLSLDYGDGTSLAVTAPKNGPLQTPVNVSIEAGAGGALFLRYDTLPVSGSLTFTNGATVSPDVTTAQLAAILNVISPGVYVTGAPGEWVITGLGGTLAVASNTLVSPFSLGSHDYPTGQFTATLTGQNFALPPESISSTVPVDNSAATVYSPAPMVTSPILPADAGYPNADQWEFNLGRDTKVLASAVKLILITEPGDRVMMPEYGCALRQFVFAQNSALLASDVSAEVQRAVSTWEPRVKVDKINAALKDRAITVTLFLTSLLDSTKFKFSTDVTR